MSIQVTERFHLPPSIIQDINENYEHSFGFGGFGELTYYRTYSRPILNQQENWLDTCVRVTEGVFSIRKDWYKKVGLKWNERQWQETAKEMLTFMYQMKFLPPGRGLFSMGSEHVFSVGSMALNNCATTHVSSVTLADDLAWSMDALMCGCGVGYKLEKTINKWELGRLIKEPSNKAAIPYSIPDTREGWVESVRMLINAYMKSGVIGEFDYSLIRSYGEPIKGFGGVSSGPAPLIILHSRIRHYFKLFMEEAKGYDGTRLVCDLINAVGTCVVSGNVRRGAQIIIGSPLDTTFLDIKNYGIHCNVMEAGDIKRIHDEVFELSKAGSQVQDGYWRAIDYLREHDLPSIAYLADRLNVSGLSNNSCAFESSNDFSYLERVADKTINNADMGLLNVMNIQKYGRYGQTVGSDLYTRPDLAASCNPCGEIPLENKELCNLVELFPTRCESTAELFQAARLATIYAQSVSLLMTHSPETNSVLSRNRRIGVSISGIADWLDQIGATQLTRILRDTYRVVRKTAREMAREAGVPEPIRVTTVKPSGTISQLAGVSSGMHFPTFQYAIRRIRITKDSPIAVLLAAHDIPFEDDRVVNNTSVFEFPINQGKTRPAVSVSAWEQFALLAMLQREWADNMVSCTIYWNEETEKNQIEQMLGQFAPLVKSVSMAPHSPAGAFPQMPYEGISPEQYVEKKRKIKTLDFSSFSSLGAQPENKDATLFCENDSCEI